jgi:hypothetical protein
MGELRIKKEECRVKKLESVSVFRECVLSF